MGKWERGGNMVSQTKTIPNVEIVKVLVQKGADVNARNKNGLTSLTRATLNRQQDIVRLLQEHGARE